MAPPWYLRDCLVSIGSSLSEPRDGGRQSSEVHPPVERARSDLRTPAPQRRLPSRAAKQPAPPSKGEIEAIKRASLICASCPSACRCPHGCRAPVLSRI